MSLLVHLLNFSLLFFFLLALLWFELRALHLPGSRQALYHLSHTPALKFTFSNINVATLTFYDHFWNSLPFPDPLLFVESWYLSLYISYKQHVLIQSNSAFSFVYVVHLQLMFFSRVGFKSISFKLPHLFFLLFSCCLLN
jgi:hypothetical protein